MKTIRASYRHYVAAAIAMLLALFSSQHASAQQVGFYPVTTSISGTYGHAVGDLNNDGRDDLIAVRFGGSVPDVPIPRDGSFGFISRYVSISLISTLNAADGSFGTVLSIPTNLYTYQTGFDNSGAFVKQFADINGDGILDAVLNKVYIDEGQLGITPNLDLVPLTVAFLGKGNGSFNTAYVVLPEGRNYPVLGGGQGTAPSTTSLSEPLRSFGDFDNDGLVDVITFVSGDGSLNTYRFNKGVAPDTYINAGTFVLPGESDGAFLSLPYRFGSGATPGVLLSQFRFSNFSTTLIPVVTRPGPQKQYTSVLASVSSPIFSGTSFTLTADVRASGPITPTGSVTFKLDSTVIGSANLINGVATLNVNNGTSAGSHLLNTLYNGDAANSTGESATIGFFVQAAPLPKISAVNNVTVKEGQKALFHVSLSAATTHASSIRISLIDITTTSGLDYSTAMRYSDDGGLTYQNISSGGTANIRAGVASLLVQVTTLKDALEEPSETYQLEAQPVTGLSAGIAAGTGTILNKSRKEKSLVDQVRGVADSASKSAESISVKLKNWVMSSGFSGLFAWR